MIAKFPYGEALVKLAADDPAPPGAMPHRNRHRLHELGEFGDDALIRLLDGYPRERIQVFTMGTDPTRSDEWAWSTRATHPAPTCWKPCGAGVCGSTSCASNPRKARWPSSCNAFIARS